MDINFIELFFGKDFVGGPFVLFSPTHLAALAVFALAIFGVVQMRDKASPKQREFFRYSLAGVLIVDEIFWHLWNATTGQWSLQTTLPLHLCSVLVFLSAYMLVKKDRNVFEFAYLLGIPGALQAVLTPDLGIYDFPHFRYFQVFISHGSIILAALYMAIVEGYRPYWASLRKVIVWANIYMLCVTGVNVLLGSNYLYTLHKPETASLLDVLGPWPLYLIPMELLGLAFAFLLYLPFAIRDRFAARVAGPA